MCWFENLYICTKSLVSQISVEDAINHAALDCWADEHRLVAEESHWRGAPWIFGNGNHIIDQRSLQALNGLLTKIVTLLSLNRMVI